MKSVKPTTEETEVPYPSAESSVWIVRVWYATTRTGVAAECAEIGALLADSTHVLHTSWTKTRVYAVVDAPGNADEVVQLMMALIPKAMWRRLYRNAEAEPNLWAFYDIIASPSAEVAARKALGSRHQCVKNSWGCVCGQLGNEFVLDNNAYREVGQMVGRGAARGLHERPS